MPDEKALPSSGDFYHEVETAKQHGGWGAWVALSAVTRAKLLAHEHHKRMREHYDFDVRKAANEPKPPGGKSALTQMREAFYTGKT